MLFYSNIPVMKLFFMGKHLDSLVNKICQTFHFQRCFQFSFIVVIITLHVFLKSLSAVMRLNYMHVYGGHFMIFSTLNKGVW